MVNTESKIALSNFLASFCLCLSVFTINISEIYYLLCGISLLTTISLKCLVLFKTIEDQYSFGIAIRSSILGALFALGLSAKIWGPLYAQIFGTYVCLMAFFHYSEFLALALIDSKLVSTKSFMLNHSPQYVVAAITSWVEFFTELYFFGGIKQYKWISNIGFVICIAGEILRKAAMFQAGVSFNHLVQHEKAENHKLVTNGVYSWFRHPSYVGWFYWSIGTQITLLNPICVVAYTLASWFFFKERIFIEEITLLNFFGQQYCDYQDKVGTGLPFIRGYLI